MTNLFDQLLFLLYRLVVALRTRFFTLYFEKSTMFCDYQHFTSISTIPTQSVREISSSWRRYPTFRPCFSYVNCTQKKAFRIIFWLLIFLIVIIFLSYYIAMTSAFLEFQRYLNDCQMSYGCRKRYHQSVQFHDKIRFQDFGIRRVITETYAVKPKKSEKNQKVQENALITGISTCTHGTFSTASKKSAKTRFLTLSNNPNGDGIVEMLPLVVSHYKGTGRKRRSSSIYRYVAIV